MVGTVDMGLMGCLCWVLWIWDICVGRSRYGFDGIPVLGTVDMGLMGYLCWAQ